MIRKVNRKALDIKYSGRSSDYITPSFNYGCLYSCAYCYMRRNVKKGVSVAKNIDDILKAIIKHHNSLPKKQGNQTHNSKWTYDIGCNEDVALHWKYTDWEKVINTLIQENIFPTFATKFVNKELLNYRFNYQARIRFSLMPQELSTILEPNTSSISDRIEAITEFFNAGWDVHINFSPVIINKGTKKLYKELFEEIDNKLTPGVKRFVKSEVIMLTHNIDMHKYNLENNPEAEELLWQPDRQELKKSSYQKKATTLRYKWRDKASYIKQFKQLYSEIIPWNEIRYIF